MEKIQKTLALLSNLLKILITIVSCLLLFLIALICAPGYFQELVKPPEKIAAMDATTKVSQPRAKMWQAPDTSDIPKNEQGDLIRYGRELIVHTAEYLGPKGKVMQISNGMNCQNCHLDAGTKIMGNNYAAVYSTYPKFRARSGTKETVIKRISDCFERSLNGTKPDSASREMTAMMAYMKWLEKDTPKGETPKGTGLEKLAYLDRAADPKNGSLIYQAKCESCHGVNGEGILNPEKNAYVYPPLWGKNSYNDGAGLYRVSSFAGYVVNNMPFGASYENKLLTDKEAWDLAAFVNSQPRPHKDQSSDWVDISKKPIDFPFAPYADGFSQKQHKLGPFEPISKAKKESK
ncbi:c-type cytochrome [Dyadobacter sandarakinus]|uniref:C-type cytochrome n=1 Tax=Dyadobacter sandarakinus TaxID=2747268 RepID=A0ABX7I6S8_9BACT|nr:c-type cytochrome [Dyadobacter sandarakinus]QRR01605.1 c-type cytochrome [Dyadobacter sandarakinus]